MSDSSAEFTGRTIEEAIQTGLDALGLERHEADIEVVQHPRRKFLGRVDATVRIARVDDWDEEEEEEPVTQQEVVGQPEPDPDPPAGEEAYAEWDEEEEEEVPAPAARPQSAREREELAYDTSVPTPAGEEENERVAVETLNRLLGYMGFEDYEVQVAWAGLERERPILNLHVVGPPLGRLIGYHGATLRNLQFVLRLLLSQQLQDWPSVNLDVDSYQLKQQANLKRRALKIARDVVSRGRPHTMEAMSAADRRIVHLALQNHPDVYTESKGSGSHRKVVIYASKAS